MVGERAGTIFTASERLQDGGEGRGGTAGGVVCVRELNPGVGKGGAWLGGRGCGQHLGAEFKS